MSDSRKKRNDGHRRRGGGGGGSLRDLNQDAGPGNDSNLSPGTPGSRNNTGQNMIAQATSTMDRRERENTSSPSAFSESSKLEWDPSADVGTLNVSVTDDEQQRPSTSHGGANRPDRLHRQDFPQNVSPLGRIALNLTSSLSGSDTLDKQKEPPTPTTTTVSTSNPSSGKHFVRSQSGSETLDKQKEPPTPTTTTVSTSNSSSGKHFVRSQSGSETLDKQKEPPTPTTTTVSTSNSSSGKHFVRSRSQEEEKDFVEPQPFQFTSGRSISMIELGTLQPRTKPVVIPTIKNIQNQGRRDTSSRDSVTTILSSKKVGKDDVRGDESLGRLHSTPSGSPPTGVTPVHSPIHSSNPATTGTSHSISNQSSNQRRRHHHRRHKNRPGSRNVYDESDALGQESSDDLQASGNTTGNRRAFNRDVSDASTDWEYGHSRSHSNENDASSASEWQTNGLTKSEIEYRKKRADDTGSSGGSYALKVELVTESKTNLKGARFKPNNQKRPQSETANFISNKAVQTEESTLQKRNKLRPKVDAVTSVVSRSNQTQSALFDLSSGKEMKEKDRPTRNGGHHIPKHMAVAKLMTNYISSELDSDQEHAVSKSSSSDLSQTCQRIRELVRQTDVPRNVLELMESHRMSHIGRVRKALRGLEKLNKILCPTSYDESTPSYNSGGSGNANAVSAEDVQLSYDDSEDNVRVQLEKKYTKKHHAYYTIPEAKSPPLSTKTSNAHQQRPSSSKSVVVSAPKKPVKKIPTKVPVSTQVSSQNVSARSTSSGTSGLEQMIEHLLNRFDLITDLLVLNQEEILRGNMMNSSKTPCLSSDDQPEVFVPKQYKKHESRKPKQTRDESPEIVKPGVCYFIPYTTNCQYSNEDRENIPEYTNCNFVSLQEIFRQCRPNYIARSRHRESVLARLKEEREYRAQTKREWFRTHPLQDFSSLEQALPPKGPRLMSSREMRELTNKNYMKLPEVQELKLQRKVDEEKRTNRLISQAFAKKLRQGALRGDVNIELSKSVIRR